MTDPADMPLSPFNAALQRALKASAADDSDTAIAALSEALQIEPGAANARFMLGAQYAQMGRLDEAEEAFMVALLQDPELHTARFQLGLLQMTRGKPVQAALTWQGLGALQETHPLRLFSLGMTQLAQNNFEAARTLLQQGIESNRENLPLNQDMQKVLLQIASLTHDGVSEAATQTSSENGSGAGQENHFLVSTYQQTLH